MSTEPVVTEPVVTYTYMGRRTVRGGKVAYFYLDEQDLEHGYAKPLVTAKVGALVEVTYCDPDKTQFWARGSKAPRVTGYLPDDDERRIGWSLEDKVTGINRSRQLESERIAKAGTDPLLRHLKPVREEIARMTGDRQVAAVSWIMTYLLTGRPAR